MAESDRPNVLHPRVLALSDRPIRPPGGSRAFQRLQKAAYLPANFAIWQDGAPYGSKTCPGAGMGSFFQKWCCGAGETYVLGPGDDKYDKWTGPCSGGSWAVGPKKTTSTAEYLSS